MLGTAVDRQRNIRADLLRQHVSGDRSIRLAARKDQKALDVVAKLAHVARPIVGLQHGDGILSDPSRSEAGCLGHLSDEKLNEFRNVFAPLSEARNAQGDDVQPVIEILTEPALADVLIEVARRSKK